MNSRINHLMKNEHGITALETAIILIAFVVVAAIFAFTVLSTGTFLTERSKEAAYSGLQEVRGSMELKGSLVLETSGATKGNVIVFNLATVAGGSSVDLKVVNMFYRDANQNTALTKDSSDCSGYPSTAYHWCVDTVSGLTNDILKSGDLAKIKVYTGFSMTPNWTFAVEVKPPTGGTMLIERTAPAQIDSVTDLH